jgi:hypothetical protein
MSSNAPPPEHNPIENITTATKKLSNGTGLMSQTGLRTKEEFRFGGLVLELSVLAAFWTIWGVEAGFLLLPQILA